MRSMLCALGVALLAASAPGQSLPPLVTAVQKFILDKDYPEVFGAAHYKTKVQNAVIADLDGDGQAEVILHFMPHYRQSPPIIIYRVAPDMTVTRVKEGFAPGPLVPLTDAYLDSHTLGEAADLDLQAAQHDPAKRRHFVETTLAHNASLVEYANFFHFDSRIGSGTYVDMSGLPEPPKTNTCEDFEFSPVRQVSAGSVAALGAGNQLAAWVGAQVYLYRVKAFLPSGLIEKEAWVVTTAKDFRGFASGGGGPLRYVDAAGTAKPFAVQCANHLCTQMVEESGAHLSP